MFHGPVPYKMASPGAERAAGESSRLWAAAHEKMLPVKGSEGMGMPACPQTQVANSEHHASHGP